MHRFPSTKRHMRILIGIALVASGLIAAPNVVQADQFTALPGQPVVEINTAPGESSAAAIQPKYRDSGGGTSEGVYSVTATVTTNATLAAFKTITMCWYKASVGADELCTTPDPQNAFQMVWTEATAADATDGITGFAVTGTNDYVNSGSQTPATGTAAYDSTAQSLTINFSFRVSNAMLAGSDWAVKVTAVYDDNLCDNPFTTPTVEACPESFNEEARTGFDEETGRHVSYWGEMIAARESLAYGLIAPLATSSETEANEFSFVANAPSDFTMAATDFSYDPDGVGPTPPDVIALTTGSPGLKRARLECRADEGQTNAGTLFLPLEVSNVSLGATIVATGETVNVSGTILCTLQYGSGAGFALKQYSNTVTLAIAQSTQGSTVTVDISDDALDTIQKAINVAETNDTVVVPAGTFVENLAINKRITLQCANVGKSAGATPADRGSETVIQGQATVSAAGVVIDGCNFLRPAVNRDSIPKLVSSSGVTGVVTVKNSIFDFTWEVSDRSCGAGTFGAAAWQIFDNKFLNAAHSPSICGGTFTTTYNSRAVHAESGHRIIVRGNHFLGTGQQIFLAPVNSNADYSEIINNRFTHSANRGINVGAARNVLIKGNSFEDHGGAYLEGSTGAIVENNNFSGNGFSVWTAAPTSSVTVRFNTILGKYPTPSFGADLEGKTFFNYSANPVDARLNYWGSAAGPGSLVGGTGSALVSTSPWIASYADGSNPDSRYTTGFWPTGVVQGN